MRGWGIRTEGGDSAPLFTAEDIEAMLRPSDKFHRTKPGQKYSINTRWMYQFCTGPSDPSWT